MCIHIVDPLDQFWATYKFIFLQLCGLFDHSVDEHYQGHSESGKCGNTHQAGRTPLNTNVKCNDKTF